VNNIKMGVRKIEWAGMGYIELVQDKDRSRAV
jgi:hypothetical protein